MGAQHAEASGRAYSSPARDNQARATRRAIVTAAADLFVEKGYAATTIDAVAERAGVGRKTVFSSVGGKGALLKLAWDWALVGDDAPVNMTERPVVQAILAEHDPVRLVRMWVEMVVDAGTRASALAGVVLAAADVDAEARALSDLVRQESLVGATAFVTHLAENGGLRVGLSVERGADTCWAIVNALFVHLLVDTRGWSPDDLTTWLNRVVAATLLEPESATGAGSTAVVTTEVAARHRYQAAVEGRPAGHLAYRRTEDLVVLLDTHVEPGFEDSAVAGALVRAALDDVRAAGTSRVVAHCPYAVWWIGKHPDYAPLVYEATGRR